MAIQIEIHECKFGGETFTYTARTDDWREALRRALKKYGKGTAFVRDRGISVGSDPLLGSQYGQIGRPCRNGVNMNTGRVRINATQL